MDRLAKGGRLAFALAAFIGAGCGNSVVDLRDALAPNDRPDTPPGETGAGDGGGSERADTTSPDTSAPDASAADTSDAGSAGDAEVGSADGETTIDVAGETAPPVGRFDGNWSGTTSQGKALTFVLNGGILEWRYGWALPMCASTTEITFAVAVPITAEGAFMRVMSAGAGGVSTTFAGQFASPTTCQGTIDFELKPIPSVPSCSGKAQVTFTATRQ